MSFIVSIVIALFFFFGGCLQLGAYIARNPVQDVPAYVDGLMLNSWPLAVAAVLFMLVELRLHGEQARETEYAAGSSIEHPVPQRAARPAGDVVYFRTERADVQASEPQTVRPARVPQVPQQAPREPTPVVTPPPFERGKEKPRTGKQTEESPLSTPEKGDKNSDLSFFKL